MRKKKRGQAALEFLMTYGWAFLVIMIMVGALAYFGVLDPTRFLPDRCSFGTPLLCQDDRYTIRSADDGTIIAGLINQHNTRIEVYEASLSSDQPVVDTDDCDICFSDGFSCTGGEDLKVVADDSVSWGQGESKQLVVDCTDGEDLPDGSKYRFDITMRYYGAGSSEEFSRRVTGEIYSEVQEV